MTKEEIIKYTEIKKEFEEKYFPLTERENILLSKMKPTVAIRRLKRARILIEECSHFDTAKEDDEFIEKHLRPILFDKSTTKAKVETMVMKARGLYIKGNPLFDAIPKIYELIEGFSLAYPNYGELEELDVPEGTERIFQFKLKLPIVISPKVFKNTCSTCGVTFRSSYKLTSPIKQCKKCFKKGKKKS